jgi:hypothetical protein
VQNERHGANHEHDGAPSGGARKNRRRTAWAKRRLAPCSAKSPGKISGFAALEQNDNNQNKAVDDKKSREHPREIARIRQPPSKDDNREADQQRDGPFHPTWHFYLPTNPFTIFANDFASRLAPPTSAPSSSSCAIKP